MEQSISYLKTHLLIFSEIIAVYCENHTKRVLYLKMLHMGNTVPNELLRGQDTAEHILAKE